MAFRRVVAPQRWPTGDQLTSAMVGIGMNFDAEATPEPNIEDTVVAASLEAMERDDLRVLDILVTWLEVHHGCLNADRLLRAVNTLESKRTLVFWVAEAGWLRKDRRFTRLSKLYEGTRLDLLRAGTGFLVQRDGEDPRFRGTPLRIPKGVLRSRSADVLTPAELARRHRTYYYRILMGPTYRADMWAALEQHPDLAPADLARRTYGSFATAWQVKRDWELLAA